MALTEFWNKLTDASARPDQRGSRLWDWLCENLDLAFYKPQASTEVEISCLTGRDGQYYVLKNTHKKTYYRIGERDYFIWERMDGSRTVKDLVVEYFGEYGSFAFARIASLVVGLKNNWMLSDPPVNLYREVKTQLDGRRLGVRLQKFGNAFTQKPFPIKGIDGVITWMYRRGGWLLFTRPIQVIFVLISVAGVILFARTFNAGSFELIPSLNGSYFWGAVALGFLLLVALLAHEFSHALAVKHYGREVRRAGVMIYLGMPGFFVDTTDIWMEGKRARLAVTWAGPFSGLVLAGIVSIVFTFLPDYALDAVLFRFAFLSYMVVFFNTNPLLKLDGYYLLMDWVEIPHLRGKSIAFLRNGLPAKLVITDRSNLSIRSIINNLREMKSFSREEKIFTVYGVLSILWTIYAISLGFQLWPSRLIESLQELMFGSKDASLLPITILTLLLSIIFVSMIIVLIVNIFRRSFTWAYKRGILSNTRIMAGIFLGISLLVSLIVIYSYPLIILELIVTAALGAALFFAWKNAKNYLGSRFFSFFRLIGFAVLSILIGEVLQFSILFSRDNLVVPEGLLYGLSLFASVSLLFASASLWRRRELKLLSWIEKIIIAVGIVISIWMVIFAILGEIVVSGVPVYVAVGNFVFPWLALVLLVPALFSYWRTRAGPAWIIYALALGWLVGSVVFNLSLLVFYLLLLSSLGLHFLNFEQLHLTGERPQVIFNLSDNTRLERAFSWTMESIIAQFREVAGNRQSESLGSDFDRYAVSAGWNVKLVDGHVQDTTTGDEGLIEHGEVYAAALTLLLNVIAKQVGEKLTIRMLQSAYDTLPWEEREIGDQYCFRHVKMAQSLSEEFRATQHDYTGLLRRMPLFATMRDDEIHLLVTRLKLVHHSPGDVIIRQGKRGDRFYIIRQGHVQVTQRDEHGVTEVVNQLYRGDYFGELALLEDTPRNATCTATVPSETLTLSKRDFDELVRDHFEMRDKLDDSIANAELLRRIPIFSEMDGIQIQHMAAKLQEETIEAGEIVIRQGEVGDKFYVIKTGKVLVYVSVAGVDKVIAERGPGEYVGEVALLLDEPRSASVKTLTPVSFLTLERKDFNRLVTEHLYVSRGLERVSSRRMIDLRRVAVDSKLG